MRACVRHLRRRHRARRARSGRAAPHTPQGLADGLTASFAGVDAEVEAWRPRAIRRPARRRPTPLQREALYQQRIFRHLARRPKTARRTLRLLPPAIRGRRTAHDEGAARASSRCRARRRSRRSRTCGSAGRSPPTSSWATTARRSGASASSGTCSPPSTSSRPASTSCATTASPARRGRCSSSRRRGGRTAWAGTSATRATRSWAPRTTCKASGAPGNLRRALYAYNPSDLYVSGVLNHARRMQRDPNAFYAYYAWSVYVRTPDGERRLTGPEPRS